nr:hypothetical protein [Candidatus Sigynarchaeum springense]
MISFQSTLKMARIASGSLEIEQVLVFSLELGAVKHVNNELVELRFPGDYPFWE